VDLFEVPKCQSSGYERVLANRVFIELTARCERCRLSPARSCTVGFIISGVTGLVFQSPVVSSFNAVRSAERASEKPGIDVGERSWRSKSLVPILFEDRRQ
jgi:hypothetical protein